MKQWIQNRIAVFELTDYATVVQKASIVEAGSEQTQKEREGKKRKRFGGPGGSYGSGSFQQNVRRKPEFRTERESVASRTENEIVGQGGRQSGLTQSMSSRPPPSECRTCGKKHTGICVRKEVRCFRCGQTGHFDSTCSKPIVVTNPSVNCFKCGKAGHMARDCRVVAPTSSKQSGNASNKAPTTRTFNMTVGEAIRDPEVITGTLSLNYDILVFALVLIKYYVLLCAYLCDFIFRLLNL